VLSTRPPSAQKRIGHTDQINRFLKTGDTVVVKRRDMLAKSIDLLMLLKAITDFC
jgi:hypothetical protein